MAVVTVVTAAIVVVGEGAVVAEVVEAAISVSLAVKTLIADVWEQSAEKNIERN